LRDVVGRVAPRIAGVRRVESAAVTGRGFMSYTLRWPNADAADPAPSQHFPHFMPGHLRRSSRGTAHGDDPRDVAGGPALGCARNADFGWRRRPVASPWFVSQPVAGFAIGCG